ncbi:MAG: basic amino acid ABC transporter substrate-binding protein [Clostridia bacterium]|nr:basic amino acid ABC transporter substrate-binding protein [Clostridia bacterium]
MKKYAKLLAAMMAVLMLMFCFAACGSEPTEAPSTDDNEAPAVDTSALNLQNDGVLVMGTNAEFPPFEYEEGGAVVGLDAEMMEEVAKRLGVEIEIKNMAFDSLPEALTAKEIDCIAAGLTVRPDREEVMSFTDGYYVASQSIIVKKDSAIATADDLTDKKIGCQSGTTGSFLAEEYTDVANISGFANGALAVEALVNGQVDAVIIDNNPANEYGAQYADQVVVIEGQFEDETYAVAVAKDNTALCDAINDAIEAMKADGTFDTIVAKYIK